MIADRYRIVGLLGRGGMGEVYRADDLRLGQPVALKFLPESLAEDPDRLARFVNEARLARQVTHPNVCRVHDLGEVDGQRFLSMELVDGEDLGTLLRRIGRIPEEKAVQIARQLCAGLAAAHEQGILHRDLKPANIMLDGRGRVRITDFGLAGLAGELAGDERAGTPAYQSPEQLEGRGVSAASDLYSLGLVLYELFTGKRAFESGSLAELRRDQLQTMPTSLSEHVSGLDDAVERVILRCLAPEPGRRPESVLAVAAALPGADPLAAALAAGETPSPEMVANAGEAGSLRPWVVAVLLLVVLAGTGLQVWTETAHSALGRTGLPKPAVELQVLARQALELAGLDALAADSASGLFLDEQFSDWAVEARGPEEAFRDLAAVKPRPAGLWYRQSPKPYEPRAGAMGSGRVNWSRPVSTEPGAADLRLDAEGRLTLLRIVPPPRLSLADAAEPDWGPLLERVGLAPESLQPAAPRANPPLNCDRQWAWTGLFADQPDLAMRVEACTSNGRPAYLELMPPWHPDLASVDAESKQEGPGSGLDAVLLLVASSIFLGAALLARRHRRLGRVDRSGALRLAVYFLVVDLIDNIVESRHQLGLEGFFTLLDCFARALFVGLLAYVLYLAVEPIIRRLWPQTIIGWRRLLDGRFRDPLVGRDLLMGAAAAQVWLLASAYLVFVVSPGGLSPGGSPDSVRAFGVWLDGSLGPAYAPLLALFMLTMFVLLRVLLRKDWVTWLVATGVMTAIITLLQQDLRVAPMIALSYGTFFLLAVRFGLLALAGAFWTGMIFADPVRVWQPEAWFFPYVVATLSWSLLPALHGALVSLGARKFLDPAALSD